MMDGSINIKLTPYFFYCTILQTRTKRSVDRSVSFVGCFKFLDLWIAQEVVGISQIRTFSRHGDMNSFSVKFL